MGIKERQERDREAVRRSILDAARELFVSEGYRNVSIRKIAEKIEYSPAALYGYFPSKDDIFYSLADEGFRLLHDGDSGQLTTQFAGLEPLDRIKAIFWRLYEFSRQHPQYFELMFVDRSVPRISQAYERFAFAREMKSHLVGEIQSCIDSGALPSHLHANVVFRLLTMGLLGAAMMRLSDRLSAGEDADALARDVLSVTLRGLKVSPALESIFVDVDCVPEETPAGHAS
jgi:AcrR family transcriptional regulator